MPTFLNSPLLWGLAIVAAPVIIHMINMLRHRRVKWAAMEFLLAGQKKHSSWIRLKEILLLLMRMAAIAAVVLIVARPRLDGGLGKRLGDVTTHHIVLLDDSFSMSDRPAERNVFDEAKEAVERIALEALNESSAQTLTLLRMSQAAAADGAAKPDIYSEVVNSQFVFRDRNDRKLNRVLEALGPSESAAGPAAALKSLSSLLKPSENEERILYIVSDFRAKDWREATELHNLLASQDKRYAQKYFVDCTDAQRPNLAVVALGPKSGTVTAGVHFEMQVEVRNYGLAVAEKTPVEIRADGDTGGTIFLDPIQPGKSVVGKFFSSFSDPGEHLISVALPADSVAVDNERFHTLNLPAKMPILVVNGDPATTVAADVAWALAPTGPITSGLAPQVQPPAFLNDADRNPLGGYWGVYLANVKQLDEAAVRNLEAYAASGGGVVFLVGDQTSADWFNSAFYRDGKGLFPVPLDSPKQLFRDRESKSFDIVGSAHPLFARFADERNSVLREVTVQRYFGVSPAWQQSEEPGAAKVIGNLRNGAPLAVEMSFGKGRVVAILTSPVSPWSDWKKNPSFLITLQETQSYVARRPDRAGGSRLVGAPLVEVLDPKIYLPKVDVTPPGSAAAATATVQAMPTTEGLKLDFAATEQAGYYRLELTKLDNTAELRHAAVNVDAREGDLARVSERELAESLDGVRFLYRKSDHIQPSDGESTASTLSTVLLYALVALLIGEQALAYSCSYHPPRQEVRR